VLAGMFVRFQMCSIRTMVATLPLSTWNRSALRGALVEEFIVEFEGTGKDSDLTRWSSLTDIRGIEKEMLSRLDTFFETWLNP
jgi:hypothetical protein